MANRNLSLFDGERMTLQDSIDLTLRSLIAYGVEYRHWCVAYSGGKDSSTLVTLITWAIKTGKIPTPKTFTVLYADTRQEIPPLHFAALQMLDVLRTMGVDARIVWPALDDRYFVYMLGRGVPPPNNGTLRWCTPQLKVEPMIEALKAVRDAAGEKILMLTGVRVGESAARDQRIALSCSKNGSECGQGWFQETTPESVADTLAPLLHWRVCHVWDWLTFEAPALGFPTRLVAEVYGGEEAEEMNARTGCIGCPLATKDKALDYVISLPQWSYLAPLKRLRPLYTELRRFKHRLQKDGNERNKDGRLSANPGRKGPLTMEARRMALAEVLGVQNDVNAAALELGRPTIDLINDEELARICELIEANTWPNKWTGNEPAGDLLLPQTISEDIRQPLLAGLEGI